MPAPLRKGRGDETDRCGQLRRILTLLRLLSGGRWTLNELASMLHCTTRTIRRDLALLEEVHAPIEKAEDVYWLSGPVPYVAEEVHAG